MPDYLSVKNLSKFQHYKHRNPPWIKLYREFWTDHGMLQLSVSERLLFIGCCSLAAECENKIPFDAKYLSHRLGFPITVASIQTLINSTLLYSTLSLREQVASEMLAPCMQSASTNQKAIKGTVYPEGFEPDDRAKELAKGYGLNIFGETAAFRDHHVSKGTVFKDWQAALRNWLRNAVKFKQRAGG